MPNSQPPSDGRSDNLVYQSPTSITDYSELEEQLADALIEEKLIEEKARLRTAKLSEEVLRVVQEKAVTGNLMIDLDRGSVRTHRAIEDKQVVKKYEDLKSLVEDVVQDTNNRKTLLSRVDEYQKALDEVTSSALSQQNDRHQVEMEKQRQNLELEKGERTTQRLVWVLHRVLDRSLIATLIGGALLFIITGAMIVAMFQGSVGSDILQNAFLVLLGYFFGQLTGKTTTEAPPKMEN